MFNHIFVGTNDIDTSRKFYDATMGVLGFGGHPLPHGTVYPSEHGSFIVAKPGNGEVATCMNGFTFGFKASDYATVDAWYAAGFRAQSPGNMYGAYLRDPDGHKICAFTANVGEKA